MKTKCRLHGAEKWSRQVTQAESAEEVLRAFVNKNPALAFTFALLFICRNGK